MIQPCFVSSIEVDIVSAVVKNKKKKKNKKLLVQIGMAQTFCFLIVFSTILVVTLFFNLIVVLNSTSELMKEDVLSIKQQSFPNELSVYAIDIWSKYADEIKKGIPYDEDSFDRYVEIVSQDDPSIDDTKAASHNVQLLIADSYKRSFEYDVASELENDDIGRIELIDVSDHKKGYIIYDTYEKEDNQVGECLDFTESKNSYFIDLIDSNTDVGYQTSKDKRIDDFFCYEAISFVKGANNKQYALVAYYSASKLQRGVLWRIILRFIKFLVVVLVLSNIILLVYVYKKTISPLKKIQKGIRHYIISKDTQQVCEDMDAIKSKNEIADFAQNISNLAVELERYTDEKYN